VLCRASDPLEYEGSRPVAEAFRAALNNVLEAECLAITYVGGRPVVGDIPAGLDATPVFSVPDELEARLARLINDPG
jgi:hypothetical protein